MLQVNEMKVLIKINDKTEERIRKKTTNQRILGYPTY